MNQPVNPSRRGFVFAGAAGASLTILPALMPAAVAKAPMAGSQVISVHRMKLGSFEVTTVMDGFIELPPAILQGDADTIKRAMEAGGLAAAPIRTAVNCFLVNTGSKLVMIDAGGAKMLGPTAGRMPALVIAAAAASTLALSKLVPVEPPRSAPILMAPPEAPVTSTRLPLSESGTSPATMR